MAKENFVQEFLYIDDYICNNLDNEYMPTSNIDGDTKIVYATDCGIEVINIFGTDE